MPRDPNQIHISKMTGKLDGLRAINTNTVTNEFCIAQYNSGKDNVICTRCYSHESLDGYRKNMQPALQDNSNLLSSSILEIDRLPFLLDAYLRIDGHGELINDNHLINIYNLALKNSHCNIAIWTKRIPIVRSVAKKMKTPDNIILVYSNPIINKVKYEKDIPEFFHKVFNNVWSDHKVEEQNCTGQQCKSCMICYNFETPNIIIEAVKKNGKTRKARH